MKPQLHRLTDSSHVRMSLEQRQIDLLAKIEQLSQRADAAVSKLFATTPTRAPKKMQKQQKKQKPCQKPKKKQEQKEESTNLPKLYQGKEYPYDLPDWFPRDDVQPRLEEHCKSLGIEYGEFMPNTHHTALNSFVHPPIFISARWRSVAMC